MQIKALDKSNNPLLMKRRKKIVGNYAGAQNNWWDETDYIVVWQAWTKGQNAKPHSPT